MIVTREPSAENTCANSAATKPPPTITRCSGSFSDAHDGVAGVEGDPALGDRRRNHRARPAAITT